MHARPRNQQCVGGSIIASTRPTAQVIQNARLCQCELALIAIKHRAQPRFPQRRAIESLSLRRERVSGATWVNREPGLKLSEVAVIILIPHED